MKKLKEIDKYLQKKYSKLSLFLSPIFKYIPNQRELE